jgi:rhodanese-related sulfurtransferase
MCPYVIFMGIMDYFRTPDGLKEYDPEEFERMMREGNHRVIDVRTPPEYGRGHIQGSELKPLGTLKGNLASLDRNSSYLLVCATGHRSRAAAATLLRNGISNVGHLKGGMRAWHGSGKATEK